jgi:glucose/arabinose dehydrogenase
LLRPLLAGALLCLTPIACAADEPALPVELVPVAENLERPVFITHAGDGSQRLFIIEQPGRILVLDEGELAEEPFLDIVDQVESGGNEQGLLGLAFHPDFESNGRFFVNYTRAEDGATVVSEFKADAGAEADAASERVLMTIPQPYSNHNGGMIDFGPDGFLYIGMGDGGSGGDPGNRAQNPDDLLGKMLRIDVNGGEPYGIPQDNPYAGGGGRPEIYAIGLRNPWRFSFDRESGELYAGDVGQNAVEEINIVERGGNYGWRLMEGTACYEPSSGCERPELAGAARSPAATSTAAARHPSSPAPTSSATTAAARSSSGATASRAYWPRPTWRSRPSARTRMASSTSSTSAARSIAWRADPRAEARAKKGGHDPGGSDEARDPGRLSGRRPEERRLVGAA